MVMPVKTYKEMLFNQNGQEVTIKVGDVTPEGLVLAAMYDDPKTKQRQIVFTTQEHLHDWASWRKGKEMIEAFNKEGKYKGHNIKHYSAFDYPGSFNKGVDVLNMMYQNQKEIGGFASTVNNKCGRIWGSSYTNIYADYQEFNYGGRGNNDKFLRAAIRPVAKLTLEEAQGKQITFMPRSPQFAA